LRESPSSASMSALRRLQFHATARRRNEGYL
jgi:hypothetical protein